MELTELEITALGIMAMYNGAMLVSRIPERKISGIFGPEPGIATYKKLEKKGLLMFTEEDPMPDGFQFTEEVYLTDEGKAEFEKHR